MPKSLLHQSVARVVIENVADEESGGVFAEGKSVFFRAPLHLGDKDMIPLTQACVFFISFLKKKDLFYLFFVFIIIFIFVINLLHFFFQVRVIFGVVAGVVTDDIVTKVTKFVRDKYLLLLLFILFISFVL